MKVKKEELILQEHRSKAVKKAFSSKDASNKFNLLWKEGRWIIKISK